MTEISITYSITIPGFFGEKTKYHTIIIKVMDGESIKEAVDQDYEKQKVLLLSDFDTEDFKILVYSVGILIR